MLAASLTAAADNYEYLTAAYAGIEQSVALATIQKITFEDHNVNIHTSDGLIQLPQTDMERIFFSATPTAIEALPTAADGLRLDGQRLVVDGLPGRLYIYGANGQLMHTANVGEHATIALGHLAKGVYIVRAAGQTIKIRR